MIKLLLLASLISLPLFAQVTTEPESKQGTPAFVTEEIKPEREFEPYKSHWITTFGFEGMKYDTAYDFSGVEKNFSPGYVELWGGRLGFGGAIHLGAGIMATTKVEGYYVGTLFAKTLNAGPDDEDEEFAYTKTTGQVYGIDVTQSLGYMFDFKTKNPFMEEWAYLTVEPFIEVGVGRARAYNRLSYNYNTGPAGTDEGYKLRVEDELLNARIGGGLNFTSGDGFFFYMKAHVNTFDITKRESVEYTRPDGGVGGSVSTEEKDVKIDPQTTYALGGGYKF